MNRLVIVARLKSDAHEDAERLLVHGPPFDVEDVGLDRHSVYLTSHDVVFLFEGHEVEWTLNDLIDNPVVTAAFDPWRALVDGPPRLGHERFHWSLADEKLGVGLGT